MVMVWTYHTERRNPDIHSDAWHGERVPWKRKAKKDMAG